MCASSLLWACAGREPAAATASRARGSSNERPVDVRCGRRKSKLTMRTATRWRGGSHPVRAMVTRGLPAEARKNKKKSASRKRRPFRAMVCLARLEAEDRPESDVQVVVGAIVEIHHVASLSAQTENVPDKELRTNTRIKHAVGVAVKNAAKGVDKALARSAVRHAEVQESAFQHQVDSRRSNSGLNLRPEQPAEQSQARGSEGRAQSVVAGAGKVFRKVIPDVTFELKVIVHVKSQASTQPGEIGVACRREPGEVTVHSDFAMFFLGVERRHRHYHRQDNQQS